MCKSNYKRRCDCTQKLESTACTLSGDVLTITVIPIQIYKNYSSYSLALCTSLPARTGAEPVAIYDGALSYPVLDTNGQPVTSGQLRGHSTLKLRYGAGGALSTGTIPAHFTVYDGLCLMEYSSNAALQAPAN